MAEGAPRVHQGVVNIEQHHQRLSHAEPALHRGAERVHACQRVFAAKYLHRLKQRGRHQAAGDRHAQWSKGQTRLDSHAVHQFCRERLLLSGGREVLESRQYGDGRVKNLAGVLGELGTRLVLDHYLAVAHKEESEHAGSLAQQLHTGLD